VTDAAIPASSTSPDHKVLICLNHGAEDPESILIGYLVGEEYVERGGRFFACPVCVKTRNLQDATWVPNAQVAGVPSVLEYTAAGALVFNY
jgi:hypothetical protein